MSIGEEDTKDTPALSLSLTSLLSLERMDSTVRLCGGVWMWVQECGYFDTVSGRRRFRAETTENR
jgi:hypothetical protein